MTTKMIHTHARFQQKVFVNLMTQKNAPILNAGTPWPSQHHAPPTPAAPPDLPPCPGGCAASGLRSTGLGQDVHQSIPVLVLLSRPRRFEELPRAMHSRWRDESKQNLAFKKLKVSQRAGNPLNRGNTDSEREKARVSEGPSWVRSRLRIFTCVLSDPGNSSAR